MTDAEAKAKQLDEIVETEHEIIPGLFLSGESSEKNYSNYDLIVNANWPDNNVKLNEMSIIADYRFKRNKNTFRKKEFIVLNIGVSDTTDQDLSFCFYQVSEYIHNFINKNRKVLVHCRMGISRSVSFIIAYLITYHKSSVKDALISIHKIRSIAKPNSGFVSQLIDYRIGFLKN